MWKPRGIEYPCVPLQRLNVTCVKTVQISWNIICFRNCYLQSAMWRVVSDIKVFSVAEDIYLVTVRYLCTKNALVCSHTNDGYANASQSYVTRTLPVLLLVLFREGCWERFFIPSASGGVRRSQHCTSKFSWVYELREQTGSENGVHVRNIRVTGNYDAAPIFVNHPRGKNFPLRYPMVL